MPNIAPSTGLAVVSQSKFFQTTLVETTVPTAAAASTVIERKTLSGIGGRIGTRELQGG
jgi:hypothetical protein